MNEQSLVSTDVQRILAERARLLARAPQAATPGGTLEVVVLALETGKYGIEIGFVSEIQPLLGLTSLPGLPSFWAGLVNLRGHLVPLLDLRAFLGLTPFPLYKVDAGGAHALALVPAAQGKPDEKAPGGKIVLSSAAGWLVGLLVDDVLGVKHIPQVEVRAPLRKKAGGQKQTFIQGVTTDLLTILDLKALLADPRLVVQDEAT